MNIVQSSQCNKNTKMNTPILLRHTIALLFVIAAAAIGLGELVSADLHVPTARILVAECQGFEALATVGGTPLDCAAGVAAVDEEPVVEPVTVQPKA